MSSADHPFAIYNLIWIVLLVSSLVARRLPIKDTLKMALAWVAIFAGAFVFFSFKSEFQTVWQHAKQELVGTTTTADGTEMIKMGDDGHFHANVTLNGKSFAMLVDTGATTTTISYGTARKAGLNMAGGGFPVMVDTANGTILMKRSSVDRFTVGTIHREGFEVLVSDQDDLDLVGMNFLSSLKSWRVEGDQLILVPH